MELEGLKNRYEQDLKEYEALLHLKRSVKMTRINRINAANRLLQTENYLQAINIYYSCFSAILSVFSLLADGKELSIWATIMTICLAISIVYLNAQKYGNRSQELKNNYISLHELLYDIELAESKNDVNAFQDLYHRYCKLLQISENHTAFDYLVQKKDSGEITKGELLKYRIQLIIKYCMRLVIISFPIVITIFMVMNGAFAGVFD